MGRLGQREMKGQSGKWKVESGKKEKGATTNDNNDKWHTGIRSIDIQITFGTNMLEEG